ncbi:MAG: TetR/AcrR family transcriptional regulator [Proteobacteria bacterium]|nr:TetR/AcrR family transcriptional regulator [Pseudomonadota bacterium]MBU1742338.1 TetR/AcrR family transcriptional regulator [Pseudomonadota bacterium]
MGSTERREREQRMRRRHILAAARKVLAEKGIRGATMEEIAQEADYKPATLYLYFQSKDELLFSLSGSLLKGVTEEIQALADRTDLDALEKARRLPVILDRIYQLDPPVLLSLFRLQASQDFSRMSPEAMQALNDLAQTGIRAMARVFEEGVRRGVFKEHNSAAMADAVWSLFTGIVLWEESKRFFNPDKRFFRTTLEFALGLMTDSLVK